MAEPKRCSWLPCHLEAYREYHDTEWGVPSKDRRYLFEMICLEGAQSGLSWWTILSKRERYRELFLNFEPEAVALISDTALERVALDPGIVRHRGKVFSVRQNAVVWLGLERSGIDVPAWFWSFVGGRPIVNQWSGTGALPAKSPESEVMSRALKKAGFGFVGPTTVYAFMQAVGMVNDHAVDCICRH